MTRLGLHRQQLRYHRWAHDAFLEALEGLEEPPPPCVRWMAHLVTHGAYHRGQMAAELRSRDVSPPYTDFIHAVRTGAIDGPDEG